MSSLSQHPRDAKPCTFSLSSHLKAITDLMILEETKVNSPTQFICKFAKFRCKIKWSFQCYLHEPRTSKDHALTACIIWWGLVFAFALMVSWQAPVKPSNVNDAICQWTKIDTTINQFTTQSWGGKMLTLFFWTFVYHLRCDRMNVRVHVVMHIVATVFFSCSYRSTKSANVIYE